MESPTGVVQSVADELREWLNASARIALLAPAGGWHVPRLTIESYRPGAASILIWDDNGTIVPVAGEAARLDLDDEEKEELVRKAVAIVMAIADGKLMRRFIGTPLARTALFCCECPPITVRAPGKVAFLHRMITAGQREDRSAGRAARQASARSLTGRRSPLRDCYVRCAAAGRLGVRPAARSGREG